jgi:replicative DNA helicase
MSERVLADPEAEALVCAAAMSGVRELLDDLRVEVAPADLFSHANRLVLEAAFELDDRGETADLMSVRRRLEERGQLAEVGGAAYLLQLHNGPWTHAVVQHAKAIRNLARVRNLRAVCVTLAVEALGDIDPNQWVHTVEQRVLEAVAAGGLGEHRPTVKQLLDDEVARIERIRAGAESAVDGTPVRLGALRAIVPRWTDGDLHIVAARPGMGKTAFAAEEAMEAATSYRLGANGERERCCAIFVSLEMTAARITRRMLGRASGLGSTTIDSAAIADEQWSALIDGATRVGGLPLGVLHLPGAKVSQVRSEVRREFARIKRNNHEVKHLGLVVVDYLQLMRSGARRDADTNEQVTEISKGLVALAGELECPVMALSQLNRKCETRPTKKPELGDLRDSGSLEQDASTVVFLFRRPYYFKDAPASEAEAIVAKNRHGPPGVAELSWSGALTSYLDGPAYEAARYANEIVGDGFYI